MQLLPGASRETYELWADLGELLLKGGPGKGLVLYQQHLLCEECAHGCSQLLVRVQYAFVLVGRHADSFVAYSQVLDEGVRVADTCIQGHNVCFCCVWHACRCLAHYTS